MVRWDMSIGWDRVRRVLSAAQARIANERDAAVRQETTAPEAFCWSATSLLPICSCLSNNSVEAVEASYQLVAMVCMGGRAAGEGALRHFSLQISIWNINDMSQLRTIFVKPHHAPVFRCGVPHMPCTMTMCSCGRVPGDSMQIFQGKDLVGATVELLRSGRRASSRGNRQGRRSASQLNGINVYLVVDCRDVGPATAMGGMRLHWYEYKLLRDGCASRWARLRDCQLSQHLGDNDRGSDGQNGSIVEVFRLLDHPNLARTRTQRPPCLVVCNCATISNRPSGEQGTLCSFPMWNLSSGWKAGPSSPHGIGVGGSVLVSACAIRSTDLRDWVVTLDAESRILVGNPALGHDWTRVAKDPPDPASASSVDHSKPSKQLVSLDVIRKRRGRFIVVSEDGNLEIYAVVGVDGSGGDEPTGDNLAHIS